MDRTFRRLLSLGFLLGAPLGARAVQLGGPGLLEPRRRADRLPPEPARGRGQPVLHRRRATQSGNTNVTLVWPAHATLMDFTQRLYRIRVDLGGTAPTGCSNAYLNGLQYFMPTGVNPPAGPSSLQGTYDPTRTYPDPGPTYSGGNGQSDGLSTGFAYRYRQLALGRLVERNLRDLRQRLLQRRRRRAAGRLPRLPQHPGLLAQPCGERQGRHPVGGGVHHQLAALPPGEVDPAVAGLQAAGERPAASAAPRGGARPGRRPGHHAPPEDAAAVLRRAGAPAATRRSPPSTASPTPAPRTRWRRCCSTPPGTWAARPVPGSSPAPTPSPAASRTPRAAPA